MDRHSSQMAYNRARYVIPPSIATEIMPRLRRETTDAPHDLEPTPATDITTLLEEETLRVQAVLRHTTVGCLQWASALLPHHPSSSLR